MPEQLPRVLIIDFFDSYSRNLYTLIPRLAQAPSSTSKSASLPPATGSCSSSSGRPSSSSKWDLTNWRERVAIIRVDCLDPRTFEQDVLSQFDALILGPGPGEPSAYPWLLDLINKRRTRQRSAREQGREGEDGAKEHDDTPSSSSTRTAAAVLDDSEESTEDDGVPVLGVCLGHQAIAAAYGAQIVRASQPRHGQVTSIEQFSRRSPNMTAASSSARGTARDDRAAILASKQFANIPETFDVVQYNSLAVRDEMHEGRGQRSLDRQSGGKLRVTARARQDAQVMALAHTTRLLWGVQFHLESVASTHGPELLSNFLGQVVERERYKRRSEGLPEHILSLCMCAAQQPPRSLPLRSHTPHSAERAPRWRVERVDMPSLEGWAPARVFNRLVKGTNALGDVFLDSAAPRPVAASASDPDEPEPRRRRSQIAIPSALWSYRRSDRRLCVRRSASKVDERSTVTLDGDDSLISLLDEAQRDFRRHALDPQEAALGFVGTLAYEFDDTTPAGAAAAAGTEAGEQEEEVHLAFASTCLTYTHRTRKWVASALVREADPQPTDVEQRTGAMFGVSATAWSAWRDELNAEAEKAQASSKEETQTGELDRVSWQPDQDEHDYKESIQRAHECIRRGDTYELCLTTQFRSKVPLRCREDPFTIYSRLRRVNAAPYGCYFRVAHAELAILSSSPECFMRASPQGQLEMRPIKGTVRRALDPDDDMRRRDALAADVKEQAENLMIADLCRHDLTAICVPESVAVPALNKVETYQTVHQLVSTVTGQREEGVGPWRALRAAFPPGSMTGAPKRRSVELLHELEGRKPRGVYSGVLGYIALDGTSDFAVVIRTLVVRGEELTLGAGGAITLLSDPDSEWNEVKVKVEAVSRVFEAMR